MPPSPARAVIGCHQKGSSFFRSYGGNLPSSLTIVLPIALVFSTRPPVSVWGTGTVPTHCWAFLGSMESADSTNKSLYNISEYDGPTLIGPSYMLTRGTTIAPAHLSSCVPRQLPASRSVRSLPEGNSPHVAALGPGAGTVVTGISTSCASATPFGLVLAPDSPWGD